METDTRKAKFLDRLATPGTSIQTAATEAGVSRPLVYSWAEADPAFRAAWQKALRSRTPARKPPPDSIPDVEFVGADLRAWLTQHQITALDTAYWLGIPLRTLYRWLGDTHPCRTPTLLKFRLRYPPDA